MTIKITEALRNLRRDSSLSVNDADAIGVTVAHMVEDAADRIADRLLIRLGSLMIALAVLTTAVLSMQIE